MGCLVEEVWSGWPTSNPTFEKAAAAKADVGRKGCHEGFCGSNGDAAT